MQAQISTAKGIAPEKAKEVLKKAQAVCFDVDSTVCSEEGIDVLADFLGQGKAVADLTAKYVCMYVRARALRVILVCHPCMMVVRGQSLTDLFICCMMMMIL